MITSPILNTAVQATPLGGLAVRMINATGAASIRGTILSASTTTDMGVELAGAGAYDCIGVMYSDGIPDGGSVMVIVTGIAQVLLKDATTAIRDGWVKVSDVAGRADASGAVPSPPTDAEHFREIGHCLEAKDAGTDVLALITVHFN